MGLELILRGGQWLGTTCSHTCDVVRDNLCMHTNPKHSPYPTPLSGDLSVLATFIHLKVINFQGCKLVTGRCGAGGGRGGMATYRDFYLGWRCIVYHTHSKTLSTHTLTSGDLSALAALINLVELNCCDGCKLMTSR